ncbi:MAG: ABC transporter permease [Chloroflexota bacterium]
MSNLAENVRIAFTALFANKLRAILTTIGIGIGIAAVIVLVSLGNAAQSYINRQFLGAGADLITVRGSNGGGFGGRGDSSGVKLGMRDVALLQNPNNVSGVQAVVPVLSVRATTEFAANTTNTQITGTTSQYFDIQNRTVDAGRLFDSNDDATADRVAVLGQTTVQTLFTNGEDPIGQTIKLGAVPFKIIGTMQTAGSSGLGADQDDMILVPISTAQAKLATGRNVSGDLPVSTIYLKVAETSLIPDITDGVTSTLRVAHKLKPTDDNDFNVSNSQDTLASLSSIISALTAFLAVVGGISLVVGGIGVMNIMLVTVTERTREIGLRKAVGAKFRDILTQFLTESIVLCFVGGFAGLLLSFGVISLLGSLVSGLQPSISFASVILAVGIVTIIGVFFGLYPASRAAALSPIAALRTE